MDKNFQLESLYVPVQTRADQAQNNFIRILEELHRCGNGLVTAAEVQELKDEFLGKIALAPELTSKPPLLDERENVVVVSRRHEQRRSTT